jgi:hypothetical protein
MPCDQMIKVEIKERQASLSLFPNTPHDQEWTKAICIEDESENQQAIQQPSTIEEGPNAILFLFTQSNVIGASIDDVFKDPFAAFLQEKVGLGSLIYSMESVFPNVSLTCLQVIIIYGA